MTKYHRDECDKMSSITTTSGSIERICSQSHYYKCASCGVDSEAPANYALPAVWPVCLLCSAS